MNPPETSWVVAAVHQYQEPLLKYATHRLRDRELARDVVQNAFLKLCRQSPSDVDGHLCAWLFTICRNQIIDLKRKEQRMPGVSSSTLELCAATELEPLAHSEQKDLGDQVSRMLEQLSEAHQEVVRLRFLGEMSYREIAEVTGLSTGSVSSILHHALLRLRELMYRSERNPLAPPGRRE